VTEARTPEHALPEHALPERVVAVLGRGVVPQGTAVLCADDLGVLRGDGIFETMHVRAGEPWELPAHLARMASSAALLDLDLPDPATLTGLVTAACAAWPADTEGALRLVCTRGPESGGPATVFVTVGPIPDQVRAARRRGIAVTTVPLGVAAGARRDAPWLLGGAKSLSYAVNMASLRWAQQHGADDVLWVSADGYALEGPTSSLVWLEGGVLWTVPVAATGILPGTTARWLLDNAGALGFTAGERLIRPRQLAGVEGVWFTSSLRGCVQVRRLDGQDLPASPHTATIQALLGFPR
jgi:4-amino-4-deoxychorismate lyase